MDAIWAGERRGIDRAIPVHVRVVKMGDGMATVSFVQWWGERVTRVVPVAVLTILS